MRPCYIIEQTIIGYPQSYFATEISKVGYYHTGWAGLWTFVDNKNDADVFHSIEDAQKTIKRIEQWLPIDCKWQYKHKILNYCPV